MTSRHTSHCLTLIQSFAKSSHIQGLQYFEISSFSSSATLAFISNKVGGRQSHGSRQGIGHGHTIGSTLFQQLTGGFLGQSSELCRRFSFITFFILSSCRLSRNNGQGSQQWIALLFHSLFGQDHGILGSFGGLAQNVFHGIERKSTGSNVTPTLAQSQDGIFNGHGHFLRFAWWYHLLLLFQTGHILQNLIHKSIHAGLIRNSMVQ
mmetsp:Transcript_12892/g.26746  ORF Transcript_12892/g.26746 Transcript_12892/m.26746 type:complete len:207 (+) Transcript_12892:1828-2448(+)